MNHSRFQMLFVCLILFMVPVLQGQEFSLDDNPSTSLVAPVGPFFSAEDEYAMMLPSSAAGLVGPSPSLAAFGFFDSDILFAGPALLRSFPAPPYFIDAFSRNHLTYKPEEFGDVWIRFSVDRSTGGMGSSDASWQQAMQNEQAGDIFQSGAQFVHPGSFVPLPGTGGTPFGGNLGTVGTGVGWPNTLVYDHWASFGLIPIGPGPYAPIFPGSHDNIDGFNELFTSPNDHNIYFCVHAAGALAPPYSGLNSADIYQALMQPWMPAGPITLYAAAPTMGLNAVSDSIDALVVWDNATPGALDPGQDYAIFSLAPGSATLASFGLEAGSIYLTDFRGFFYKYLFFKDLGVGNRPRPPLPVMPGINANVDALEIAI